MEETGIITHSLKRLRHPNEGTKEENIPDSSTVHSHLQYRTVYLLNLSDEGLKHNSDRVP